MPPNSETLVDFRQVSHVRVDTDQAGRRVDNFLQSLLRNVPKSRIYRMLRTGEVRINGKRATPDRRLEFDDLLRIPPVTDAQKGPLNVPMRAIAAVALDILYEDADLLVVNKPPGIAVHGGSGVALGVIEALRFQRPAERSLELVHRLDRDTSGCLMVARKSSTLRALHRMLREGTAGMEKHYLALVAGSWPAHRHSVRAALHKQILQGGERMVQVRADGKPAVSHFRVREALPRATLVDVALETGRTHQIRVHAAHAGHPLAGDDKYGDKAFNRELKAHGLHRIFLHAAQLSVPPWTPGGQVLSVRAPLPAELAAVLASLRHSESQ